MAYAKITSKDGSVYEGETVDGRPHGKGKKMFSSGTVYEGDWFNGHFQGKGNLTEDGTVYEGDFNKDKMHGQGIAVFPDGEVYEGSFANNTFHGKGKYSANGCVFEGNFVEGKRHGKGKITYSDGCVEEGKWDKGNFISNIKTVNEESAENTEQSFIEQGDYLIEQGDYIGAVEVYTEAICDEPDEGLYYQLRADAYIKNLDLDSAIADYTKAIELYDDEEDKAMVYIYRAVAYIQKGEYHNVMADANAALKTGLLLDKAYLTRGTAYFYLGPMGQAFVDWKKAADLGSKGALKKLEEHGIKYTPLKKNKS